MNKQNIPQLRFPGFEGEWSTERFKNLVKINQGLQIAISERYTEKINGSHFYITNEFLKEGSKKSYYILNPPESVLCKESDVLMTRTGNTGQVVTNVVGAFHNNFFKIKYDAEFLNKDFLVHFLKLFTTQNLISRLAGTSTIPDLNHSDFYRIEISRPTLPEQTKIASFLTAVDKRINLLQKKKTQLEQYKKGAMQKIFNQELRFRDDKGNSFPDWEEKKLGEIVEFISTNSFSRDSLNYNSGTVKNIHYGDIHTKFRSNFNVSKEKVPYINEDVDLSKITDTQYCIEGDLVIADASEDYKDIGKAIEIVNLGGQKVVAGLHTYIARDKIKMAIGFKAFLMQAHYIKKQIIRIATGISVLGISKTNLSKIILQIPVFEEQQKIASFLSSIDKNIEITSTQIKRMQEWKKGLLQKMFV